MPLGSAVTSSPHPSRSAGYDRRPNAGTTTTGSAGIVKERTISFVPNSRTEQATGSPFVVATPAARSVHRPYCVGM